MSISTMQVPARRYGFKQAVRAEVVKMATLRSTVWTLLVTVIGSIGVTIIASESTAHRPGDWGPGFDPTNQALGGIALATLAIGVLGVMVATGEYATGTIRSTLAAAPRRPLLLLAKATVLGGVALVASEVLAFSCFGVGQAIFAGAGAPTASLAQPDVLRAVALSGGFLALLGLFGLGLGIIVRHTAGAIGTYVGLTFLIPLLMSRIAGNPSRYTPIPLLANSVSAAVQQFNQPSPQVGFLLMVLYAAAVLGIAAAMIVRRDA